MRPLVWFRSDLRVRDNTALYEAARAADQGIVAVFAICPEQWSEHDWAAVKVEFLLRNLQDLSRELSERGIPLLVIEEPRFEGVPGRLLDIADEHECGGLWFNLEYEVNERARDEEATRRFADSGRSVHSFVDQTILSPHDLRTSQGSFYSVFTPYRKKWLEAVRERDPIKVLRTPPKQEDIGIEPDEVPSEVAGFTGEGRPDLWKSGTTHALSELRTFARERMSSYDEQRDLPAVRGTSVLSPYLALGVLSPRQCLDAALQANDGQLDGGSKGVATWISELIWREFYRHVLVGFPRVCRGQPFDLRTRDIEWREDEEGFARWKEGRTGVPIVDAGMRQLRRTGWMHNRLRMVTAMFLTKNLFVDWRLGERHFMRHLVDGDFASNNGGWQWSASVGTDAAPYFRVFSPLSQSERFDPDGAFIRRLIPELSSMQAPAIHLPGERAPEDCEACGYPAPIVDLKSTRKRAIERFKQGMDAGTSKSG